MTLPHDQDRYARHLALPEIGAAGQKQIESASVLCVGAGGLGAPALQYLAAAGIGHIGIIDADQIEISNLQRQILYAHDDAGQHKALKAKDALLRLNPGVKVTAHNTRLTSENAEEIIAGYDVVLDGTDNFETKFLINDACFKLSKPFVYGSVQNFEGQVSVFDPSQKNAPCYRCLFPQKPQQQVLNCAESGVLGAVAGMVGTTQALQVLNLVIAHESLETLTGRLWTLDAKTMRSRILNLPQAPDCPVCSQDRSSISLTPTQQDTMSDIEEITVDELNALIKTQAPLIIDVREQEEWDAGHIGGAHHFALSRMMNAQYPSIEAKEGQEIILYCQKGVRSIHAAQILKTTRNLETKSLAGGYADWVQNTTHLEI